MTRSIRWMCICGFALTACATELDLDDTRRPVINGTPAEPGEFPATGALMAGGQFFCSGTLISPTAVLTAAHCLDPQLGGSAVPGFTLDLDANAATRVYRGESKHPHSEFSLGGIVGGLGKVNDIGVLILGEPVTAVEPAPLFEPADADAHLRPGEVLDIVGYGLFSAGTQDAGLKRLGRSTLVEVGDWELLIGMPGEQQSCNGDSGGPSYLTPDGGDPHLVGIVSRGPDESPNCDRGGVDTRADRYAEWIRTLVPDLPMSRCETDAECRDGYICMGAQCVAGPGTEGGLGETCTANADCASNACASAGSQSHCVERCELDGDDCPDGFRCAQSGAEGVCWPTDPDDGGPGGGDEESGGCAIAAPHRPDVPVWLIALAGALLVRSGRRRFGGAR